MIGKPKTSMTTGKVKKQLDRGSSGVKKEKPPVAAPAKGNINQPVPLPTFKK